MMWCRVGTQSTDGAAQRKKKPSCYSVVDCPLPWYIEKAQSEKWRPTPYPASPSHHPRSSSSLSDHQSVAPPSRRSSSCLRGSGATIPPCRKSILLKKRDLWLRRSRPNISSGIPPSHIYTRDTAGIVDTLGTIGVVRPAPYGIVDVLSAFDVRDHTTLTWSSAPRHWSHCSFAAMYLCISATVPAPGPTPFATTLLCPNMPLLSRLAYPSRAGDGNERCGAGFGGGGGRENRRWDGL